MADSQPGVLITDAKPTEMHKVRDLFLEYAQWLGADLGFQGFQQELQSLPGKYTAPDGCILLARLSGGNAGEHAIAGCVALRRFDESRCEMKRLWVRECYRGQGIGGVLVRSIIDRARGSGYSAMVLDTLRSMTGALATYTSAGFREIAPYYDNPLPGAVYLGMDL